MSTRTSLELRGKVRAVNLNLKVTHVEVVFKTLGLDEFAYRDNVDRKQKRAKD